MVSRSGIFERQEPQENQFKELNQETKMGVKEGAKEASSVVSRKFKALFVLLTQQQCYMYSCIT